MGKFLWVFKHEILYGKVSWVLSMRFLMGKFCKFFATS
jgi:hypothetical protein